MHMSIKLTLYIWFSFCHQHFNKQCTYQSYSGMFPASEYAFSLRQGSWAQALVSYFFFHTTNIISGMEKKLWNKRLWSWVQLWQKNHNNKKTTPKHLIRDNSTKWILLQNSCQWQTGNFLLSTAWSQVDSGPLTLWGCRIWCCHILFSLK